MLNRNSSINKSINSGFEFLTAVKSNDVGAILDNSFNIAVRTGLHCAPYLHRESGTFPDGMVRISPGYFNTMDEIEETIAALKKIADTT